MGTGRKLLAGAAWAYGSQVATIIAQFGYAAITSRLVGPSTFGSYAIALSVSGLVTLLAAGGTAQAVARMGELEPKRLHALGVFAILVGIVSAGAVWLTSPFWAELWGDSQSRPVIQLLAISSFVAPLVGVSTSVMRRQGSFRELAILTFSSNLVGMIFGSLAVLHFRSGASLAVSAIIAQSLLLIGSLLLTERLLWGFASVGHARQEVFYSANLTTVKLAEYLIGNLVKFSTSRWLGPAYFGFWNRADMLATLPFQQVQNALLQAISPEFRHDVRAPERAFRVWTDLLILVAWFVLPASAVAAVAFPILVPFLFGPGWQIAASLTVPLAIAAGLQTVSTVLSSAVEALGRFKWMWATSAALIALQLAGAAALIVFRSIDVAMACVIATQIARHVIQLGLCRNAGYIDLRRLLKNYLAVLASAGGAAASAGLLCWLVASSMDKPVLWAVTAAAAAALPLTLWRHRQKLPPYVLAQKYGLGIVGGGH